MSAEGAGSGRWPAGSQIVRTLRCATAVRQARKAEGAKAPLASGAIPQLAPPGVHSPLTGLVACTPAGGDSAAPPPSKSRLCCCLDRSGEYQQVRPHTRHPCVSSSRPRVDRIDPRRRGPAPLRYAPAALAMAQRARKPSSRARDGRWRRHWTTPTALSNRSDFPVTRHRQRCLLTAPQA